MAEPGTRKRLAIVVTVLVVAVVALGVWLGRVVFFPRRALALFTIAVGLSGAVPVIAQDAPPTGPRWVSYCAASSADSRAAQAAVRALGDAIEGDGVPLDALAEPYRALSGSPCFASMGPGAAPLESRAALRVWWSEGGLDWLWHFAMGRGGAGHEADDFEVAFPPDPRPALSLESSAADHPLRALLCREDDAACGRETAGWILRAEAAFDAHAARERAREQRVAEDGGPDAPPGSEDGRIAVCARDAAALPAAERFPRWRSCVSAARDQTSALPVGRVRAPTRGWLVLRGRRGHYGFCDEIRAYDLATGAAYVASRCANLFTLGPAPATPPSPTQVVTTGRVPVDALREAAWMLLLASSVDHTHVSGAHVRVPEALPLRWDGDFLGASGRGGGWGSSAQTRLGWAWVFGARVLAQGQLTWPDSDRAAEAHAASLVRVAEAALAPGCAPAPLPRGLSLGHEILGVSPVDADAATLENTAESLELSLRAARAPRCR